MFKTWTGVLDKDTSSDPKVVVDLDVNNYDSIQWGLHVAYNNGQ